MGVIDGHEVVFRELKMENRVLTQGPRYVMIADGALSHLAHQPGQLTVYLRLCEEKVPAIYGPSSDEWHLLCHPIFPMARIGTRDMLIEVANN